jgi:hypothetical protein
MAFTPPRTHFERSLLVEQISERAERQIEPLSPVCCEELSSHHRVHLTDGSISIITSSNNVF